MTKPLPPTAPLPSPHVSLPPSVAGAFDTDYYTIERPRPAAAALGISLATFWRRCKSDPDFPPLVRHGAIVGVIRGERIAYTKRLMARRGGRAA